MMIKQSAQPEVIRRAVILGAGGAIGQAVATALAREGRQVVATDLSGAPQVAAGLDGHGHAGTDLDVTDRTAVQSFFAMLDDTSLWTDLVYAAGANTTGPIADLAWSDYRRVMGVNLDGAFYVAQAIARSMRTNPRPATVVFLASTAAKRGEAGGTVYCASKFGLLGLVESLAAELAPVGVRVNAVCPGNVESPMLTTLASHIADRDGTGAEAVLMAMRGEAAAGRLVAIDEVAKTCAWLASDASSGVIGTAINVDAGLLVR